MPWQTNVKDSLTTHIPNPCSTFAKENMMRHYCHTSLPNTDISAGDGTSISPKLLTVPPDTKLFTWEGANIKVTNQRGIKKHFRSFSSPKSFSEKSDHLVCFRKQGRAILKKPSACAAWMLQSFHLRAGLYLNCKAQGILQDHRKLFWESTLKSWCWKSREGPSGWSPGFQSRAELCSVIQQRFVSNFTGALHVFAPV